MFIATDDYKTNEAAIHARIGKYVYLFDEVHFECDEYSCSTLIEWMKDIIRTSDALYNKDLQYNSLLKYEFGLWCERVKWLHFTISEMMGYVAEEL